MPVAEALSSDDRKDRSGVKQVGVATNEAAEISKTAIVTSQTPI